jgi:hypothetical protein
MNAKRKEQRDAFSKRLYERILAGGGKFPLLTLDEFFEGNAAEDSLAPNQWGDGRPPLAEIRRRLRELEKRPDVAWVRVQLHYDTLIEDRKGEMRCEALGEAIAVCTNAAPEEIERAVDIESLCADGVARGWALPADNFYAEIPDIPASARVLSLVWD